MDSAHERGGPRKGRPQGLATTLDRGDSNPTAGHTVEALARLTSYRSAAQAIRRQDASLGERAVRMVTLMQEARAETDPWTRELAEQIVYAQAQWMFEGDEALRRNRIRGRLEAAARRLRLKGYECCPTCQQRVSDPADWAFWSALRRAEIDRLEALDREAGEAA